MAYEAVVDRSKWFLIENDGAIFRGPSRSVPLEVLSKNGWKPYTSRRTPDVAWGTIVTPDEAAAFHGSGIPD
jgi:hypothetical protein